MARDDGSQLHNMAYRMVVGHGEEGVQTEGGQPSQLMHGMCVCMPVVSRRVRAGQCRSEYQIFLAALAVHSLGQVERFHSSKRISAVSASCVILQDDGWNRLAV